MKNLKAKIRLHLWIETDRGMIFGIGRAQMLENIEKCGSLQKAAKKRGISYRAAWGRIKKTEEVLGRKLLSKTSRGYQLTDFGKEIKEKYRLWFDRLESIALKEAKEIFPWILTSYKDKLK